MTARTAFLDRRRQTSNPLTILVVFSLASAGLTGCDRPPDKPETFELPAWDWPASKESFVSGAASPDVPPELLAAIAQVSTGGQPNHAEEGCEAARTAGVMGLLVSGESGATVAAAAAAANLDPEKVKTDDKANIAAAAAWLRKIAGPHAKADQPADWYGAVAQWPGSSGPASQAFAASVFAEMAGVVARARANDPNAPNGDEGYIDPDLLDIQGAGKPSPDQPGASFVPACSSNYQKKWRGKSSIDRIIIHTVQGSAMGAVNWFANCSAKVSAHYTVSKYGAITQSVRDRDVGWHAGHYFTNQRSIGIEHEGFVANKSTWTEAMLNASAQLTADLCQRYDIPIDRTHIIGHNEVPGCKHKGGGGKGCHHDPGQHFPWASYMAKVKIAAGQAAPKPVEPGPGANPDPKPAHKPVSTGAGHCKPGAVWGAKGPIYRDVTTNLFAAKYIHALHGVGVVTGCQSNPPMFCPWCTISRSELVAWIARAMKLKPLAPGAASFSDVPKTDPNAGWIEAARQAGIIAGCGGGKLCATALMKRGEVAAVIAKAASLKLGAYKGSYGDVPAWHPHAKAIEALAPACIATGCGANTFCPNTPVKRSEAAFTIARAFHIGGSNPCAKPAASKPTSQPKPDPNKPAASNPKPVPDVTITSPKDGATVKNPVVFKLTGKHVHKIRLLADSWPITPALSPSSLATYTYSFTAAGKHDVQLVGLDKQGNTVASHAIQVTIPAKVEVGIVWPTKNAIIADPVTFEIKASGVATVELWRNGKRIEGPWDPLTSVYRPHTFGSAGPKWVELWGRDAAGKVLAKTGVYFHTEKHAPDASGPRPGDDAKKIPDVAILTPADKQVVLNPVTFTVTAKHVSMVRLFAGGWPLGATFDPAAKTAHTYKFNSVGWRSIKLAGYDNNGKMVASHDIKIEVKPTGASSGGSSSGGSSSGGSTGSGYPKTAGSWGYILKVDHGVRSDSAGGGHFGASRYGNSGGHSGIDFLAPSGTPLYAPCSGKVIAGSAGGYGNYVQLVCKLPYAIGGKDNLYASMLYAHLASRSVSSGASVSKGQKVGTVGKTGNASGSAVMPHVHFEVAIHASQSAGLNEYHASGNHSGNWAASKAKGILQSACWSPTGFAPKSGPSFKGRRVDPFLLLACASKKPGYSSPGSWLSKSSQKWSKHFSAKTFNVDTGK